MELDKDAPAHPTIILINTLSRAETRRTRSGERDTAANLVQPYSVSCCHLQNTEYYSIKQYSREALLRRSEKDINTFVVRCQY